MRALVSAVFLGAVLCLVPVPAEATVYKWVDENGVAHYTLDRDEIPRRFRERLRPAGGLTQPLPQLAPVPVPTPDLAEHPVEPAVEPPTEATSAPLPDLPAPAEPTPTLAPGRAAPTTPIATPSASAAPGVDAAALPAVPKSDTSGKLESGTGGTAVVAVPTPAIDAPGETPAPASDPATPHAPSASPAPGVDAALSLEQQIARDREEIKRLISSDKATGIGVANDPALREIAERLPRLQSEYEELQREPPE